MEVGDSTNDNQTNSDSTNYNQTNSDSTNYNQTNSDSTNYNRIDSAQVSNIESKVQLPTKWLYNPRRLLYITPLTVITEKNITRWNELQTRGFDISYLFPAKFDPDIYMADAAFCVFNVDKLDTAKHDTIKSAEAQTIYGKILEALRRFSDEKNISMDTFYNSLALFVVVIFIFYKLLIRSCRVKASHIPLNVPFDEKLQNKIFHVESAQKGYIDDITYYAKSLRIFIKPLIGKLCISGSINSTHRNIVMLYFMFVRSEVGGIEYNSKDYIEALKFACNTFYHSPRFVMMLFRAYKHDGDTDSAIKMLEKYFENEYNVFIAESYVRLLNVCDKKKIIPFLVKHTDESMYSTYRYLRQMIIELYEKLNVKPFGMNNIKKAEVAQLAEIPRMLCGIYENIVKASEKETIDILPYSVGFVIMECMLFGIDGIIDIKVNFDTVNAIKKDYDDPHFNIVLALLHYRAKDYDKTFEYFNLAAERKCNISSYDMLFDIDPG